MTVPVSTMCSLDMKMINTPRAAGRQVKELLDVTENFPQHLPEGVKTEKNAADPDPDFIRNPVSERTTENPGARTSASLT